MKPMDKDRDQEIIKRLRQFKDDVFTTSAILRGQKKHNLADRLVLNIGFYMGVISNYHPITDKSFKEKYDTPPPQSNIEER